MNLSAEALTTPDYKIEYDSEWVQREKTNPPGYTLTSKNLETEVTLSSLRFPEGKDLNQLSQSWLQVRIQSEEETAREQNHKIKLQSSLKEIPIGHQLEYWGADSRKRSFRFWCVIAKTKIVNIYIESYKQSPDELELILRQLLSKLRI